MIINSDSRLLFMQYNISDSQALFWCFILIILRMASLNTWLFMFSMPDFVLSFVLILFGQNLGFCSHKSALIKNRVYIHQVKRQLFSEFFSFRKSIPPTVWVERKRSHFVHQKYISLDKLLHSQKQIKEHLNSKTELFMATVSDWSPKALSQRHQFWYGKVPGSGFGFY